MPPFCELIFGHRDLTLYENMWSLVHFHHFGWDELFDMLPWEFDSVLSLTAGYVEMQEMQERQNQNARR